MSEPNPSGDSDHVDVLIIGAGLSGIGAAATIRADHPDRDVVVLERRDDLGGTWDLFRYPGIRSDSDMFTFAYRWRPWESDQTLADGPLIKNYLAETAAETGVDKVIRFGHQVRSAAWDSEAQLWTVTADYDGEEVVFTARVLWGCSGYYDYDQGFQPEFPGVEDFRGTFIHPQFWPEDLDYSGKKVVIVGSGATAVTLVPAMADGGAGQVTMLQRTPSYILSRPGKDPVAGGLKALPIPFRRFIPFRNVRAKSYYETVRWENIGLSVGLYHLAQRFPRAMKRLIRRHQVDALTSRAGGPGFSKADAEAYVDRHLTPPYDPWDQRLCAVPDGDLWRVLREGTARIATDRIERITADGVALASGDFLEADILVSATGLNVKMFGGVEMTVDGEKVDPAHATAYKATLLSGIPNFAFTIGYINASWTLKADLVAAWVSGLLSEMDEHGHRSFVVDEPEKPGVRPLMDMKSGYLMRGAALMPRQGESQPWQAKQNYVVDRKLLAPGDYHDEYLRFG